MGADQELMLKKKSNNQSIFVNISIMLLSCMLFFIIAEFYFRFDSEGVSSYITATSDWFAADQENGYRLKANEFQSRQWNAKKIFVKTNSEGRRIPIDEGFIEQRGKKQIIFVGDSYVFGNEVNAADSFVFLLRNDLDYDTINLGVGGYSNFQEFNLLKRYVDIHEEMVDLVLLFFFLGNDFQDNLIYEDSHNSNKIIADEKGRLTTGHSTKQQFGIRQIIRELVYKSHFLSFLVTKMRALRGKLNYWVTDVIPPQSSMGPKAQPKTKDALEQFKAYCSSIGVKFAVIVIPDKDQIYKNSSNNESHFKLHINLINLLNELQIDYLDLFPLFFQKKRESLYNMYSTGHFSENGHRVVADMLYKFINDRNPRFEE